jgi:hypothetical protein
MALFINRSFCKFCVTFTNQFLGPPVLYKAENMVDRGFDDDGVGGRVLGCRPNGPEFDSWYGHEFFLNIFLVSSSCYKFWHHQGSIDSRKHFPFQSVLITDLLNSAFAMSRLYVVWMIVWKMCVDRHIGLCMVGEEGGCPPSYQPQQRQSFPCFAMSASVKTDQSEVHWFVR